MYLNKNVSFDEDKIIQTFQEHVRPLLDRLFDVIKPVYEEYLRFNLLSEDRPLAFYEEVNIVFLKSFLFSMEQPSVFSRLIHQQGSFGSSERALFIKSQRTMIHLDNTEDPNGLFNDRIMEVFFDNEIKKKFLLREDKNFNAFKGQMRKFVKALQRPEIFEIFYLALQHAIKTALVVEEVLNEKVLAIVTARVDEVIGYTAHQEWLAEQAAKESYKRVIAEMNNLIPDAEKYRNFFEKP